MHRLVIGVVVYSLAITPAAAGPPRNLSPAAAKILVASAGINRGKIFAVDGQRYAIYGVDVRVRGNHYSIDLIINPLPAR